MIVVAAARTEPSLRHPPAFQAERTPNVPWPQTSRQAADPLAVLTAAAVATEKVHERPDMATVSNWDVVLRIRPAT